MFHRILVAIDNSEDSAQMFNEALIRLEDKVLQMVGKTLQQVGLPSPVRNQVSNLSREVLRETSYNIPDLAHYVQLNEPKLVPDQRVAYARIVDWI